MTKKLHLTQKEAIADCKKIWNLVYTRQAMSKASSLAMLPEIKEKHYECNCPLCEYSLQFTNGSLYLENCLDHCPYAKKYGVSCVQVVDYTDQPFAFAERIMTL